MKLFAVSINHRTAPVEIREALHLEEKEVQELVDKLKESLFREGLVLSTCNRTEVYGIPAKADLTFKEIQDALLQFKPVKGVKEEHFENFFSDSAIKHLFGIISGIDSMLIGDNQIYHQVKDSFVCSEEFHFTGVLMKRLFDAATRTGKRSITETEISEGAVTVSFAAVQLIEKIFSNLSKKSALVIGAGETGEIAAKHLRDRGIGKLTITNRTLERAEKLARSLDSKILLFEQFLEHLYEFDIILSATSSTDILIGKEDVLAAMKKRSYASTVLMDIAVPRDIDPNVRDIDYVFYHDIDSLNIIVDQNLKKRKNEVPKVEKIIEHEAVNFINWYNTLEVAPTIKNLRDHFENIRAEEVSKNINKFNEDDREKLQIITKRIINKILHHPTVELRKLGDDNSEDEESAARISVLTDLFGIENNNTEDKKD